MKWLIDRIRRQKPQPRETVAERAATEPATPDSTQPRLMLLVHDAGAPASYQLHTFEDAPSAEEFVQFWFPSKIAHGVLAFWALHHKPERSSGSSEERPAEVVILIRDEARREIVYPYSLPDMEMASSWISKEVARGLDLRLVLMYWAAPAKITRNRWDKVRITPAKPPPAHEPLLLRSSTVIVRQDDTPRGAEASAPAPADEPRHPPTELAEAAGDGPNDDGASERTTEADGRPSSSEIAEKMISEVLGKRKGQDRKRLFKRQQGPFRGFGSPRDRF
jgi:hypothetical protein